jgi:2'-5' RNA ligase
MIGMQKTDGLYMFAIVPPPELALQIHEKRLAFANKYGFVKALKPPVHITLYPPFTIHLADSIKFEKVILVISAWAATQHPFGIALHNYNFFDHPRRAPVLHIDVVKNAELQALHKSFLRELRKYISVESTGGFNPHITIGYRDTTHEAFAAIKADYAQQTFEASFQCRAFYLWKQIDNKWQVLMQYDLQDKPVQSSLF